MRARDCGRLDANSRPRAEETGARGVKAASADRAAEEASAQVCKWKVECVLQTSVAEQRGAARRHKERAATGREESARRAVLVNQRERTERSGAQLPGE